MPKVKKIELSFVCDEDWQKMTPVESGRHCAACQKTVVNFMSKPDAEIIAFYAQQANVSTCGQFRVGQLDYINKGLSIPKRKMKKSFFRPLLASALLSTTACSSESVVKKDRTEQIDPSNEKEKTENLVIGKVAADSNQTRSVEKFIPRKFTHVRKLSVADTDSVPTNDLDEVIVKHDTEIPDLHEPYSLGGIPKISFDEETQPIKGEVQLNPPAKKSFFLKRLFQRKK